MHNPLTKEICFIFSFERYSLNIIYLSLPHPVFGPDPRRVPWMSYKGPEEKMCKIHDYQKFSHCNPFPCKGRVHVRTRTDRIVLSGHTSRRFSGWITFVTVYCIKNWRVYKPGEVILIPTRLVSSRVKVLIWLKVGIKISQRNTDKISITKTLPHFY